MFPPAPAPQVYTSPPRVVSAACRAPTATCNKNHMRQHQGTDRQVVTLSHTQARCCLPLPCHQQQPTEQERFALEMSSAQCTRDAAYLDHVQGMCVSHHGWLAAALQGAIAQVQPTRLQHSTNNRHTPCLPPNPQVPACRRQSCCWANWQLSVCSYDYRTHVATCNHCYTRPADSRLKHTSASLQLPHM